MGRWPSHGPLCRTHGARPASAAASSPVEGAQFGQMAQHAQGGDRADGVQRFECADLLLEAGRADQRLLAFLFHGGHLLFQVGHEFLLLPCHVGRHTVLEGLAGPGQLFLEVVAPLHQRAQFGLRGLSGAAWARAASLRRRR